VKKGCLTIAGLVVLLVVGGGGFIAYRAAQDFGLTEAPLVSHDVLAAPETRVRLRYEPGLMQAFIASLIPPDLPIPAGLPLDPGTQLAQILPHEIALLAGSNHATGLMEFTLFVNERRGGPFIAQLSQESGVLAGVPHIRWSSNGLELRERGILAASGTLPLADGIEARILENWSHTPPPDTVKIQGGHQLELTIDNRNGEILALMATLMELNGVNWQAIFADPQFKMAMDVIVGLLHGRATADLVDPDTIALNLNILTTPETGGALPFIAGAFIQPQLEQFLSGQLGLTLTGTPRFDAASQRVIGEYRITGVKQLIDSRLRPALGLPPASAA
jgi:hypothetical protein